MRLFHVSEEKIKLFKPRKPYRKDMLDSPPLIWAINERCLPNFLTPRDCPRVTYHIGKETSEEDRVRYFASKTQEHCVAIESKWFNKMKETKLFIHEFDVTDFYLQDEIAGYYVSEKPQEPIKVFLYEDLFAELIRRNVEIRVVDYLHDLRNEIMESTLNWSMCRMSNAKVRKKQY